MKEEFYKEVGTNYRFFLGWRHAAFAGNLLVVGAALSICMSAYKDSRDIAWLIPLCAAPVGIVLWIIEVRNRPLYHAAISAGAALETPDRGFYTLLKEKVIFPPETSPFMEFIRKGKLSQSLALNIAFLGASAVLLIISLYLYPSSKSKSLNHASQQTGAAAAPTSPTSASSFAPPSNSPVGGAGR